MPIAEAQLDLTGKRPDDNGLEEAQCPFHTSDSNTLFLDHVRGAFLCFMCRGTGALKEQKVNDKRIVILKLEAYRPRA